jgi:2-polyprenyl-3-methyl-5-hydroxy-6-metoxy-1,4-benzoquinol methylase
MRHEQCPLCGGWELPPVPVRTRHQLRPVICLGCGFVMLQHDTAALTRGDRDALRWARRTRKQPGEFTPRRHVRTPFQLNLLGGLLRPSISFLDVGCGEGVLLAAAAHRGAQATGVVLSERDAVIARSLSPATVHCAAFEDVAFDEQFDVITCSHALEHAEDPLDWLRRMRALLKPGGVLFIAVPNVLRPHGPLTRTFQRQHLYYFSPQTLPLAVVQAGFAPWQVRTYAHEDVTVLAQHGASAPSPDATHAAEVLAALRRHGWDYWLSGMFAWRKIKPLRNLLFWGRWTDQCLCAPQPGPDVESERAPAVQPCTEPTAGS